MPDRSPSLFAPSLFAPSLFAALPGDLPRRPRLTPSREALWRSDGVLQFGVEPAAAVVLDGLTPPLARLVTALDGSRRVEEVLADAVAGGVGPAPAQALLCRMHAAGLLAGPAATSGPPGSTGPVPALAPDAALVAARAGRRQVGADVTLAPRRGAWVVVHGGGRLGVALACLLATSGVGRVDVVAEGTVLGHDVGTGLLDADVGRPRGLAAADAVARVRGDTDAAGTLADQVRRRPDLVVLADTAVADPVLLAGLTDAHRPHLAVGIAPDAGGAVGRVGPLVLPGRTGCLRCDEHRRTDADPARPVLAAQLTGRRPEVAVALAVVTAALAAEQALAVLDGAGDAPPATVGAVLEVDPRAGTVRHRAHPPHPACACRRPATAAAPVASPPGRGGPRAGVGVVA